MTDIAAFKPKTVYVTYIAAAPGKVWQALTEPEFSRQYFFGFVVDIAPRVGGSAAFRRFLREELMPEIDRRYRTTPERSIIGESLAGLFIVETFLEEPSLFTHYVAFDPSLWWKEGALVASAAARLRAFDRAPRTLHLASSRDAEIRGDPSRLAEAIRLSPPPELRWRYNLRRDLTHATIFRALQVEALEDALR